MFKYWATLPGLLNYSTYQVVLPASKLATGYVSTRPRPQTSQTHIPKIKARVLWDIPGSSPPRFALSLLPHVIQLTTASAQPSELVAVGEPKKSKKKSVGAPALSLADGPTLREAYPVGMLLDAVRVVRVESEWGLVCEVVDGVGGFVHVRGFCLTSLWVKLRRLIQ